MMTRLPQVLHPWLDGELQEEEFRDEISGSTVLRRAVRNERQARVLAGFALGTMLHKREVVQSSGHINANDMAAYLDERLAEPRMYSIGKHMVTCRQCFYAYMAMCQLEHEDIEPEPLPAALIHRLLQVIKPDDEHDPGWLGRLVLGVKGSVEWLQGTAKEPLGNYVQSEVRNSMYQANLLSSDKRPSREVSRVYSSLSSELKSPDTRKKPTLVTINDLVIEVRQQREHGARALVIDIFTVDGREPAAAMELLLELDRGEVMRVLTDSAGHAYILVPRGESRLKIGYRGYIDLVVE